MEGYVKFWHAAGGYGFLKPTSKPGPDVFCHFTSIEGDGFRNLIEGQVVEFDVGEGRDGRTQAVNVREVRKDD